VLLLFITIIIITIIIIIIIITIIIIIIIITIIIIIIIIASGTNQKSKDKWAVHDHRWVTVEEALSVGKYDKYVRLNVAMARQKGLL
jgi:5-bromo-4-chloroindolyl phosphate hydrolysis protein